jgi:hypothetical protein
MIKYLIEKLKTLRQLFVIGDRTEVTPNYLRVGQKFIGTLRNEHQGNIIEITERMLDDDDHTLMFLHYNGFKEIKSMDNETTEKKLDIPDVNSLLLNSTLMEVNKAIDDCVMKTGLTREQVLLYVSGKVDRHKLLMSWCNETTNGTNPVSGEVKFIPNTNYSRTTHDNMDYHIGVNGKVKTKFFGK